MVYHDHDRTPEHQRVSIFQVRVADLLTWDPNDAASPLPPVACLSPTRHSSTTTELAPAAANPPAKRRKLTDYKQGLIGDGKCKTGENFVRNGGAALPVNKVVAGVLLDKPANQRAIAELRQRCQPASARGFGRQSPSK